MVLELIILAIIIVSAVSLLGVVFFLRRKPDDKLLFWLVSIAAGTMLGAAFLDLLPEAIDEGGARLALPLALAGMLAFFVVEKVLLWHHHHENGHQSEKPVGYLSLMGDALHNFFDGVVIAAAFLNSVPLGVAATIAIIMHEIPQEIGDVGLLLYSGFTLRNAAMFNLLTALTALVGGLAFYFASSAIAGINTMGLAFTAGMFIYIAGADLVPELHKETNPRRSAMQLLLLIIGAGLIWLVATVLEHG